MISDKISVTAQSKRRVPKKRYAPDLTANTANPSSTCKKVIPFAFSAGCPFSVIRDTSVAGTGISACSPAIGLGADITNRDSVRAMFEQVLLAFGGIDNVIITAGIYVPPNREGRIPDPMWGTTFDVNVIGPYLVADGARRIWDAQGLSDAFLR